LKIIDVGIYLFYFNKISFPVHFLFKWRQNLSTCPRNTWHVLWWWHHLHVSFATMTSETILFPETLAINPWHSATIPKRVYIMVKHKSKLKIQASPCFINFHAIKTHEVGMHSGRYSRWCTCSKGLPIMILIQNAFHIANSSNIMDLACKS